jgi:4-amino-4-deoxy-L-arabinose transferase-like glycosyltransferase
MRRDYLYVSGLGLMLFLPFLGSVHLFDWDEINFAECAREMLLTGDWFRPQIDFEPFWEKPPLFLWMQALSMQIFGVNEFAARFPNALCGVATLLLAYRIGLKLHDRLFGWLWVLAWIGSILPHFYFRSGIIDPWFNFFTFCGLYGFIEFRWQFFAKGEKTSFWARYRWLLLGGAMLGLAMLTKGPTAFLVVMLVLGLYWTKYRFSGRGYLKHFALFALTAFLTAGLWFGIEIVLHGPWFAREFIVYQIRLFSTRDAGHGGFFGYHAVVLLLGCFPISVFALPNLWGDKQSEEEALSSDTLASCRRSDLGTWMQLLFWVVLLLFSVVKTKIVHYSSLAYFPITYLGAVTLWRAVHWQIRPRISGVLLPVLGFVLGGAVAVLPWFGARVEVLKPFFKNDAFATANLDARVDWSIWHSLPGFVLIAAVLVGWYFWHKQNTRAAAQSIFAGGAAFTSLCLVLLTGNIEAYSQRAAVEFYEQHCGESCFVKPIGFKSYAHLFYACKQPVGTDPSIDDYTTLLRGNPGRTVYFVAKINQINELSDLPGCRELYRKNGFVFYERKPRGNNR